MEIHKLLSNDNDDARSEGSATFPNLPGRNANNFSSSSSSSSALLYGISPSSSASSLNDRHSSASLFHHFATSLATSSSSSSSSENHTNGGNPIDPMSDEMWIKIFAFLPPFVLCNVGSVCSEWRRLACDSTTSPLQQPPCFFFVCC